MPWIFAALTAFFVFGVEGGAWAQTSDTSVSVPVGEIANTAVDYVQVILLGAIAWGLRCLPGPIYAIMMTARVDQLLEKAITYALNSVKGAAKDKVLTVDVGNRVVAEALAYALQHGGNLAKSFAGDPVTMAEKIWARLDLGAEVDKPDFRAIASKVVTTLPQAKV